jgi:hypothetical protein
MSAAMATEATARDVKNKYSGTLMAHPAVVGVGIESDPHGQFFIRIHLRSAADAPADLPAELDGVPVRAEVTGEYRKG